VYRKRSVLGTSTQYAKTKNATDCQKEGESEWSKVSQVDTTSLKTITLPSSAVKLIEKIKGKNCLSSEERIKRLVDINTVAYSPKPEIMKLHL
jgi:hypothetical protein